MWISRFKHDSLLDRLAEAEKNARLWEAKYHAAVNDKSTFFAEPIVLSQRAYWQPREEARKEDTRVEELEKEVTKLQQMYADEVKRRYELASLMKG